MTLIFPRKTDCVLPPFLQAFLPNSTATSCCSREPRGAKGAPPALCDPAPLQSCVMVSGSLSAIGFRCVTGALLPVCKLGACESITGFPLLHSCRTGHHHIGCRPRSDALAEEEDEGTRTGVILRWLSAFSVEDPGRFAPTTTPLSDPKCLDSTRSRRRHSWARSVPRGTGGEKPLE